MESKKQENIPFRPLGRVKEVLDEFGEEISYAYEDLVFVEHNCYLLQFGKSGDTLFFCENDEATAEELAGQFEKFAAAFAAAGIILQKKGCYSVSVSGDEELQLIFHEEKKI